MSSIPISMVWRTVPASFRMRGTARETQSNMAMVLDIPLSPSQPLPDRAWRWDAPIEVSPSGRLSGLNLCPTERGVGTCFRLAGRGCHDGRLNLCPTECGVGTTIV